VSSPAPLGSCGPSSEPSFRCNTYMTDPDIPASPIYPPFTSSYHKILDKYLCDSIELIRRPYGGVAASPPVLTLEYVLWVYETVYLEAFPDYDSNPMFGAASLALGLAPVLPPGLPSDATPTIKGLAMSLSWLSDVCRLSKDSVLPPVDPVDIPPGVPHQPLGLIDNLITERIRIKTSLGGSLGPAATLPSSRQHSGYEGQQYETAADPYSQSYGHEAYAQPPPPRAAAAAAPAPLKAVAGPDVGTSAVGQVIKAALALGMKLPDSGELAPCVH
jgi:hypothetical protein